MPEAPTSRDSFYEWANVVFSSSPFDPKTANLMGMAAALVSGYEGAIRYFFHAAQKAGATGAELAAVSDIVAAALGLNAYAMMPKEE